MTTYRYFLSARMTDASPPTDELQVVEADSPTAAVRQLAAGGRLPAGWESLRIHFLVWTSADGSQRGFESVRLKEALQGDD
jgi:hypothetical protein